MPQSRGIFIGCDMEQTLTGLANSHSIYIQRLASSNVNEFNEEWGKHLRKLLAALDGYSEDLKRREFNRLVSQISEVILENQELLAAGIELNLADFVEYETGYQVKSISSVAGVELTAPLSTAVIQAAQTRAINRSANDIINFKDWISDLSASQQRRIITEVREGYRNGVTLQQMTQRIIGTRKNGYTDGIADIDRRGAVTLIRTATNHYATDAKLAVYNDNSDVISGYRIVATLDSRTTDICRALDLTEYVYGEGENPLPPFHRNCRTSISPLIKGINDKPRGQRQSAGDEKGLVSAAQDYYHFLSRQSSAFQDAVLGKAVGSAFRNSGLSVSEFARLAKKNFDKPMTIAEVASWDKKLLEYLK